MNIKEKLYKIIKKILKVNELSLLDIRYGDGNWDSLRHLTLILEIEKNFNIKFKNDEIIKIFSIKDLTKTLESKILEK